MTLVRYLTHPQVQIDPAVEWLRVRGMFDDAIRLANDSDYGLTAGIFSGRQEEIKEFLDCIEAGVVYVNRHASATTGAMVAAFPRYHPRWAWWMVRTPLLREFLHRADQRLGFCLHRLVPLTAVPGQVRADAMPAVGAGRPRQNQVERVPRQVLAAGAHEP
mgnify:CR=1 FL=1